MSVTIKDIAKIANVSHTTVSRALNDNPHIKKETKEKIKALAKELGYSPNYSAKSLVLDRSYNIGLFFSTINEGTSPDFFYEIIGGVNKVIHDKYNLAIKGIEDLNDFHSIHKNNFDGIMIMSQSSKDDPFIYHVMEKKIPLVVMNRKISGKDLINILFNDRHGAYNAVKYLIHRGHRDIAMIEGKKDFESSIERKEGFIKALSEYHISLRKEYMVQGKYTFQSGYDAMNDLLSLSKVPTAVFCSNDDMAIGAMKAIHDKGLKVREDIAIIGFDDSTIAPYLSPSLSTVKRPVEEISIEGTKQLLLWIEGKGLQDQTVYKNTEIVIREST